MRKKLVFDSVSNDAGGLYFGSEVRVIAYNSRKIKWNWDDGREKRKEKYTENITRESSRSDGAHWWEGVAVARWWRWRWSLVCITLITWLQLLAVTVTLTHTRVHATNHQIALYSKYVAYDRSVWQSDRQTPTVCVMKINCESRWINCALLTNKINYYDWIKEHTRVAYRMPGVCARLTIDSELKGWRLSLSLSPFLVRFASILSFIFLSFCFISSHSCAPCQTVNWLRSVFVLGIICLLFVGSLSEHYR